MSVQVQDWNRAIQGFGENINLFNNAVIQTNSIDSDIEKIETVVREEIKRLKELLDELTRRETVLSAPKYCAKTTTEEALRYGCLNLISKGVTIAGASLAFIMECGSDWKTAGIIMFIAGMAFDGGMVVYDGKNKIEHGEASELAKLNRQGIDHALIFQEFLQKLRAINTKETEVIQAQKIEPSPLVEREIKRGNPEPSLDQKISDCLHTYEQLPPNYKREDVFCRFISHLIRRLPSNDPLVIGLNELEPIKSHAQEDLSELAGQPLPFQYLPTHIMRTSSSSGEISSSGTWNGEQAPRIKNIQRSISEDMQTFFKQEEGLIAPEVFAKMQYKQRVDELTSRVMARWRLHTPIPYFETPNGWQVTSEAEVTKIGKSLDDGDPSPRVSLQSSIPSSTSPRCCTAVLGDNIV